MFFFFYTLIVILRNYAFDKGFISISKLPVPVLAVGNITTGGTGKTPTCVFLVETLIKKGFPRPVLISRGYGEDEIRLLKKLLPDTPHFTNSKRVIAGKEAIAKYGNNITLVLDDAFQHRYLHRDLNIVLIDAMQPFGYDHLLPRGFLREPLSHLKRADLIIITKADMVSLDEQKALETKLQKYIDAPRVKTCHTPIQFWNLHTQQKVPPYNFKGETFYLFTGIGNPESFHKKVEKLGIIVSSYQYFPDHHMYTKEEVITLCHKAREENIPLVTTAKDATKLQSLNIQTDIWVMDIELQILEGEILLEEQLACLLEGKI